MASIDDWAAIVASSLDWQQAHTGFDNAIKGLAPGLRGTRPAGFPHSIWELVDHIRRTQTDLLEFCANSSYEEIKWPDDYWPSSPAPASDAAWNESIAALLRDRKAFAEFTTNNAATLTNKIPWGTGQTFLRTVLVAVDHSSQHVGQIIAVRRLLNAWPPV